jgi:PhnB protein
MTDELDLVRSLRSDADVDPGAAARVREKLMNLIESNAAPVVTSTAAHSARIVPYLIYDDVAGALNWLSHAFGFVERDEGRLVDPEGTIQHAEMELQGAVIMLGPPSIHGDSPRLGVSSMLDVTIDDIDTHYQRARAAGARVVIDLEDAPWGVRRYQATDLEGHQWQFSQPRSSSA